MTRKTPTQPAPEEAKTTLAARLARWLHVHTHEWEYGSPGIGGWGVVRCRTCDYVDIY